MAPLSPVYEMAGLPLITARHRSQPRSAPPAPSTCTGAPQFAPFTSVARTYSRSSLEKSKYAIAGLPLTIAIELYSPRLMPLLLSGGGLLFVQPEADSVTAVGQT